MRPPRKEKRRGSLEARSRPRERPAKIAARWIRPVKTKRRRGEKPFAPVQIPAEMLSMERASPKRRASLAERTSRLV